MFDDKLLALFPCRVIHNERGPYLSRWLIRDYGDEGKAYVHHFHQSDPSHELHSHPWEASGVVIAGGYREHRLEEDGEIRWHVRAPGDPVVIKPGIFHRVEIVSPEIGAWTMFTVGRKCESWGFLDIATGVVTAWRDQLRARGITPTGEDGKPLDDEGEVRGRLWAARKNARTFAARGDRERARAYDAEVAALRVAYDSILGF